MSQHVYWERIWTFDTPRFRVVLEFTPETDAPEDYFEFPEDVEAVRSERVMWFCARVRVLLRTNHSCVGEDYLGACAYSNSVAFMADAYFRDMVAEAVRQARLTLHGVHLRDAA